MRQLHFFTTTDSRLSVEECKELSEILQQVFKEKGLDNHLAVVMNMVEYKGTVTDD